MSGHYLEVSSAEQAFEIFSRLTESKIGGPERVLIAPGWALTQVVVPNHDVPSSITPVMMDAYITMQKEFFALAALAKTGSWNINRLNDIDRHELGLVVRVTEGSSHYLTELARPIEALVKRMVDKLTGRQVTIIALGVALMFTGYYGLSAWLEHRKSVLIEQARTTERIEALNAMRFATEQQRQGFETILRILAENGALGQRAAAISERSYMAFLRAIERDGTAEINGQQITSGEASVLLSPARNRAVTRFSVERMRVIDINTAADVDSVVFMNPSTREQFRVRLSTTLFSGDDRQKLFEALEARSEVLAELAFREVNGVVRETVFLRLAR